MSYILDALRKADAQRERDAARGLHAQPAALVGGARSGRASSRAAWVIGAAALAIAALVAWYVTRTPNPMVANETAGAREPAAAPSVAPVAAAPSTPPVPQGSPAAPQPRAAAEEHAEAADTEPAPAAVIEPPPEHARPAMPPANPMTGAPPRLTMRPPQRAPVGGDALPAPVRTPAAAPAAAPTTPAATGLPPDAPRLAISGGVYSPDPAQRMLIVNGQVFNEGSEVAAGVTLEKVEARTAVLRFRGARYTVAY